MENDSAPTSPCLSGTTAAGDSPENTLAIPDLQRWQDELDNDLPNDIPDDSQVFSRPRENTTPPPDLQRLQEELDNALLDDVPDGFDASLGSKYDFRIGARQNQTTNITWIDQDNSGTYDPNLRFQRRLLPPLIKRKRERLDHDVDGASKRPKVYSWRLGRITGKQLLVTLKITSENGQDWLRSVGSALDNCPEPAWYDVHSAENLAYWSGSDSDPSDQGPYKLRKRTGCEFQNRHNFYSYGEPDLTNITLGHPAARGCKACVALGARCPLLAEGAKYPCDVCIEDDIDCELVTEPAKKRRCELCLKKRIPCSYVQKDSDHSLPCQHCSHNGLKCIAGPASGRTRTGPSLDQVFVPSQGDPSAQSRNTMKSCAQCSSAKKWCSLKNKNPQIPCKYCSDNGMTCTFAQPRRRAATKSLKETVGAYSDERNKTRKVSFGPTTNIIQTHASKAIRTRLAHPINFNYEPIEGDIITSCHWCDDLIYGLLGLGEVEVEVKIPNNDNGQGYIEIDDGHVAAGYPASRMCDYCTIDRIRILSCQNHEIGPIEGMDPEEFDYESNMDWLEPGKASSAPFMWCSLCPATAFFACCAKDEIGGQVEDVDMEEERGCGLFLCESCAVAMVNDHDGHLEGLLDRLKMDEEGGGFNIRADADFLHPKGELMRRMGAIL